MIKLIKSAAKVQPTKIFKFQLKAPVSVDTSWTSTLIPYMKLKGELTFVMWKREGSNSCHATWQSENDQDEVDLGGLGLFFAPGLVNLILITFAHEISEAIVRIPL